MQPPNSKPLDSQSDPIKGSFLQHFPLPQYPTRQTRVTLAHNHQPAATITEAASREGQSQLCTAIPLAQPRAHGRTAGATLPGTHCCPLTGHWRSGGLGTLLSQDLTHGISWPGSPAAGDVGKAVGL